MHEIKYRTEVHWYDAFTKLTIEKVITHRKQRTHVVESAFGYLKANH